MLVFLVLAASVSFGITQPSCDIAYDTIPDDYTEFEPFFLDEVRFGKDVFIQRQLALRLIYLYPFAACPLLESPTDDWLPAGVEIRTPTAKWISSVVGGATGWTRIFELSPGDLDLVAHS